MNIDVLGARLVFETREIRLNRSVARQFPILEGQDRAFALEQGDPVQWPICKVLGKTLGKKLVKWLYLVTDPVSGYAWVPAHTPDRYVEELVVAGGGTVDDPLLVPTVVL